MMKRLKESEVENSPLESIDLETPIDASSSIQSIDGSHKLYYGILQRFEDKIFNQSMDKIATALNQQNYEELENVVTLLKEAFRRMRAGRLQYICHFILEEIEKQQQ